MLKISLQETNPPWEVLDLFSEVNYIFCSIMSRVGLNFVWVIVIHSWFWHGALCRKLNTGYMRKIPNDQSNCKSSVKNLLLSNTIYIVAYIQEYRIIVPHLLHDYCCIYISLMICGEAVLFVCDRGLLTVVHYYKLVLSITL